MTLVGAMGILMGLLAAYIAEFRSSRVRVAVFMMLFVLHTLASAAYYIFAEAMGSDAQFYYYDPMGVYGNATGLSTVFVINMVQTMREYIGGTLFDHFMIFQAFGFWGMVFLVKTIQDIYEDIGAPQSSLIYLPLFLPGLHYWTSAVGKDSPLFLAITLTLWSLMRVNKRLIPLGIAILIMLLFRAHIAVIILIAIALCSLFERRMHFWIKALLMAGLLGGAVVTASSFQSSYQLDISNADTVSNYLEGRTSIGEDSGADLSITNASLPGKVLTFWFRPFFFDAEDLFSYVVSMENLALMIMAGMLLVNFGTTRMLVQRVLYLRVSLVAMGAMTLLLSMVSFNLGLNVRQKTMLLPFLIVMFTALTAVLAVRRQAAEEAEQRALRPAGSRPLRQG